MDFRDRQYYLVVFSQASCEMRISILKNIPTVKIHYINKKKENRNYQMRIGCSNAYTNIVEFELRKAARRDDGGCKFIIESQ